MTADTPVIPPLTDPQFDALRELANIASGSAATALSQLLAREVNLSVPRALALPLAQVVETCGSPEEPVAGVVIDVRGEMQAMAVLLIGHGHADTLCSLLGVTPGSDVADSALREIGNILCGAYLNGLGTMTGLEMLPSPPHLSVDMLGAIVASLVARTSGEEDVALLLDSELAVAGESCSISFLLLPAAGGISDLLSPLGPLEVGGAS
jgi:chemotaxis protein CheC